MTQAAPRSDRVHETPPPDDDPGASEPRPAMIPVIREVAGAFDLATRDALADILVRVVAGGASVSFIAPLDIKRARAFWDALPRPDALVFVASDLATGHVVGTAQLHLAAPENGRHRAEVAKVLVHPDWQRRGVARALLRTLEARAADLGRTTLILDTREGDPSNGLYRGEGWTQVGRIDRYCRSNDGRLDATILYAKWLDAPAVARG